MGLEYLRHSCLQLKFHTGPGLNPGPTEWHALCMSLHYWHSALDVDMCRCVKPVDDHRESMYFIGHVNEHNVMLL